ncbi:hypothetical protein CVH10_22965, partial [Halomonas sp. ND22Bw]|uniref:hypothetical protein n=1 Tax=Halomonas sp. ND22Bw TaxID=2054178 RepID=UPI000D2B00D4
VGALVAALLLFEDKQGLKGFGSRLVQWTAQRRLALGMVVGTTSVVVSVATVVGLCSAVVVLVLLPLPAYVAGKEEGTRLRSLT